MLSNDEVLLKRNDDQFMQMKGGEITLKNGGTILKLTGSGADLTGNLTVSGKITAQGDVVGCGNQSAKATRTPMLQAETGLPVPPSA